MSRRTSWPYYTGLTLEMVPNDLPYPKTWGLKKNMSLPCIRVAIHLTLLHKVVHDHLQPVQAVLDLLINLRALEMVPKDSTIPIPKNLGFKKK